MAQTICPISSIDDRECLATIADDPNVKQKHAPRARIILVSFAWVFGNTLNAQQAESRDVVHADVCVYGGTPGGITAAISAAREGASVVLLEQTRHLGGLSTSGLNLTSSLLAAVSAIGNVGPAYDLAQSSDIAVRPGYDEMASPAQLALAVGMVFGRFEVLALLSLFNLSYWRS